MNSAFQDSSIEQRFQSPQNLQNNPFAEFPYYFQLSGSLVLDLTETGYFVNKNSTNFYKLNN